MVRAGPSRQNAILSWGANTQQKRRGLRSASFHVIQVGPWIQGGIFHIIPVGPTGTCQTSSALGQVISAPETLAVRRGLSIEAQPSLLITLPLVLGPRLPPSVKQPHTLTSQDFLMHNKCQLALQLPREQSCLFNTMSKAALDK